MDEQPIEKQRMNPGTADTDHHLLLRLRKGDEEAFVTLYRKRQGAIYRFALHMSGSSSSAEDVTQEVFLALLREECGFDPARGEWKHYLGVIARNALRRIKTHPKGAGGTDNVKLLAAAVGPEASSEEIANRLDRDEPTRLRALLPALEATVKSRMRNPERFDILVKSKGHIKSRLW